MVPEILRGEIRISTKDSSPKTRGIQIETKAFITSTKQARTSQDPSWCPSQRRREYQSWRQGPRSLRYKVVSVGVVHLDMARPSHFVCSSRECIQSLFRCTSRHTVLSERCLALQVVAASRCRKRNGKLGRGSHHVRVEQT